MKVYMLTFMSSRIYSRPSGLKLAEFSGFSPINSLRCLPEDHSGAVLIRYGVSSYPTRDIDFKEVLNKADDIRRTINKALASRYMILYGVRSPKVFFRKEEISEEDLPVLSRRLHHSRGQDIRIITTKEELNRNHGDYYTKFIPSVSEYRLHVFKGEPIRLQKKVLVGSSIPSIIRNVEHGYVLADHYNHNIEAEKKVIEEGLKAVRLFHLDFGAVDILVGEDNTPYILEINTAPRLNKFGRQLYSYYFKSYLGLEIREEDYTRLRPNEGKYGFDLPIKFRDIVHSDRRNVYE